MSVVETRTYRQRSVEVEAFQWRREMGEIGPIKSIGQDTNSTHEWFVLIDLAGHSWPMSDGDWVVNGRFKLNNDLFNATYEVANR